jgi:gliding motility associated protien GldN
MKIRSLLVLLVVFVSVNCFGQVLTPNMQKEIYKDDFIDYEAGRDIDSVYAFQQRKVIDYASIREADVMWSQRIWRRIEVKEKLNLPIFYPLEDISDRDNLLEIIKDAMRAEEIQPFDSRPVDADEFKHPMAVTDADSLMGKTIVEQDIDEYGDPIFTEQFDFFTSSELVSYEIKEDWYFDKQRSQTVVEIRGIMPIFEYFDGDKGIMVPKNGPWFYFPEVRYALINKEVFNRNNESARLTFDDLFMKRYFSSHIVKAANVYNRSLLAAGYKGLDLLLEAENLKKEMFIFEHDLWSF